MTKSFFYIQCLPLNQVVIKHEKHEVHVSVFDLRLTFLNPSIGLNKLDFGMKFLLFLHDGCSDYSISGGLKLGVDKS